MTCVRTGVNHCTYICILYYTLPYRKRTQRLQTTTKFMTMLYTEYILYAYICILYICRVGHLHCLGFRQSLEFINILLPCKQRRRWGGLRWSSGDVDVVSGAAIVQLQRQTNQWLFTVFQAWLWSTLHKSTKLQRRFCLYWSK